MYRLGEVLDRLPDRVTKQKQMKRLNPFSKLIKYGAMEVMGDDIPIK